jgi:hypothetical protein
LMRKLPGSDGMDHYAIRSKALVLRQTRRESESASSALYSSDTYITHVVQLFVASACDSNISEAQLHGRTLQSLLRAKYETSGAASIDPRLIVYIAQHDYHIAQLAASYSTFDIAFWLANIIDPYVKSVSDFVTPLYEADTLSPSLAAVSPALFQVVLDMHRWIWLWCSKAQHNFLSDAHDPKQVVVYFSGGQVSLQYRLSDHLVLMQHQIYEQHQSNADTQQLLGLYKEAILASSLLAYLATFSANPRINGQFVWRKAGVFLSQLPLFLLELDQCLSQPTMAIYRADYNNVMLFGYWAGATWEHGYHEDLKHVPADWFTRRFRLLALQMAFATWEEVRWIIDMFCSSNLARPGGETWVNGVLGTADRYGQGELVVSGPIGPLDMTPAERRAAYTTMEAESPSPCISLSSDNDALEDD